MVGAGLTAAQVAERVARGEVNDVPARSSRSVAEIIRANTLTPFNGLLGTLLAVILVVGPLQDALFGFVIVSNTLVGIVQELRAKRTLDRLAIVGEVRPTVRRDGRDQQVHSAEVVLGDILVVGLGDKIVVDGEITGADGLEVDESLLTGEADPVIKEPGDPVLSGSFVAAGTGGYRATKVGRAAYAAQLAEEASRFTLTRSELRTGIDRIITVMALVMAPVGVLLFLSQLRNTDGVTEALRGTVAGLVTMVPEGLVLLTSVAFAVGVVRLGRHNVLVQELPAIEGLARVDVICLDKTGTLTEPGMTVHSMVSLDDDAPVRAVLGGLAGADPRPNPSLQAILAAYPDQPEWAVTAVAPFSSARKWSGVTFEGQGSWLLGAPEVLLPPADPTLARATELAGHGLRVLLLARAGDGPVDAAADPGPASPAALIVIEQPVRPDAAETLRYFESQQVGVRVISGDSPGTVGAIAARLGVEHADRPVDARTLPTEQPALAEAMHGRSVFGRVAPQQKQAMVSALQSRRHVVAMTGDGVNDVLALKTADIGIAMGNGSDATRAVAQLLLLDSKFAVLPQVVAEGRRVIGNIERVANLFLTKTVYATLLSVAVIVAGLPFPFLPRHLTLIGSLTIGTPAFFLALQPNTQRAQAGFVHRVIRFAVPSGFVAAAASFAAYGTALLTDRPAAQAQTTAALVLFTVALWVLAIVARPFTGFKLALVVTMGAAFLVVLAVPWLRHFFALTLPPWTDLSFAAVVTGAAIVLLEGGWRLSGWRHRHHPV
ncbi:MAG TPA: HAD-IC family P-type ATPase [Mycobacteriales bacterium]|nr:HAD-IC family P-type ATPase [Mycobacteriales bacterium]